MERKFITGAVLNSALPQDSYLRNLPAVRHLMQTGSLAFTHDVTFFVGENGTGKSTLLEAIAVAYGFNAEGGTKNFSFATSRTHSALWEHLTLSKARLGGDGFFLRAESFYNAASYLDELDAIPAAAPSPLGSYGGKSLHKQSHGESFLALVQNRFGGKGIYILDEPEAALSPAKLMTLLAEMDSLVKRESQFIIATHSPILMTFPGAEIYEFSENGIASVDYKETAHFQLTKHFLNAPEQMLRRLLSEEENDQ